MSWTLLPENALPDVPSGDELFAHPRWVGALAAVYRFPVRWATDGSAALPFAVLDDLAGRRVVGFPFSDYLPIDDPAVAAALFELLGQSFPTHRIVLKTRLSNEDAAMVPNASVTRRAVYHRMDATSPPPDANFRRNVRKGKKHGHLKRDVNQEFALDKFYALYTWQRYQKFGSIPQPKSFFARLQAEYSTEEEDAFWMCFDKNFQAASAHMFLPAGRGLFYKFGTTENALQYLRPNNLLFDAAMELVRSGAYDFLDFGLSGTSEKYAGLRRFKASTGATELPLTYLERRPSAYDDRTETLFKQHLGALTKTMVAQELQPDATSTLSEHLYPYFA